MQGITDGSGSWATRPLDALLRVDSIRRRLIFALRHQYHHELECNVPLGHGLVCPIDRWETWSTFGAIFFENEYAKAFSLVPPPDRWIDIGCYSGFFSLYLVWLRAQRGLSGDCRALLIDGDPRWRGSIERLCALNHLENRFLFKHGVIARDSMPRTFVQRSFGNASIGDESATDGVVTRVAPVMPQEMLALLPPPYDMIKIDIEGGEFDFLIAYGEVLKHTKHLLMEWHSWHPGGGGLPQLRDLMAAHGFELVVEVLTPDEEPRRQGANLSGVDLYRRA